MANWLLKSEPGDYSYSDLRRDGKTAWNGVRNALALKHMRQVGKGDLAFFYHTGSERAIVGIVNIESDPYRDPQGDDEKIVVFDVSSREELAQPVSLSDIKKTGKFDGWELVRLPRLSVMPVPKSVWSAILSMSRR